MNAIPVNSDNEKFQKYIEKEFKKIYMDGFTNGMKTTAENMKIILIEMKLHT